jgi:hypothetical protein
VIIITGNKRTAAKKKIHVGLSIYTGYSWTLSETKYARILLIRKETLPHFIMATHLSFLSLPSLYTIHIIGIPGLKMPGLFYGAI